MARRTTCLSCGCRLIRATHVDRAAIRQEARATGARLHKGRDLCEPCYDAHLRLGVLDEYPPINRPSDGFVEDLEELLARGLSIPQAAERLHVPYATAYQAIYRYRKRHNLVILRRLGMREEA